MGIWSRTPLTNYKQSNSPLDPESWDGNFHAISLHGSMEHLASDIKHIKESLRRMQKYILNKLIEGDKANNIKNLEGVGEAAWGSFLPSTSPIGTISLLTRITFLSDAK